LLLLYQLLLLIYQFLFLLFDLSTLLLIDVGTAAPGCPASAARVQLTRIRIRHDLSRADTAKDPAFRP
jgi:hypothetical protein